MTIEPSPEQRIVGCTLSNFLADRRNQIVSQWMEMVISDRGVPAADDLTLAQIKDHVPQILDDLNKTLENAFDREVKERASWRAATHGHIRWEQRYDIAQLIREISDLRTIMVYHLADFHDERIPSFNGQLGLFAMIVLHSFFDRVIRVSVEQFIASSGMIQPQKS